MASTILELVNALKSSSEASKVLSVDGRKSFEELFSYALRNTLDLVNSGGDPFEFEDLVLSTLIVLAEDAGYSPGETKHFINEVFDEEILDDNDEYDDE